MSLFAAILFFLLLVVMMMMDGSMGLPLAHPLHAAVDAINESGPFVGVVMAYPTEEEALRSSGEFVPGRGRPFVDLYGRRFHIGSIRHVNVVHVMSGQRRLNAGITVQILLDVFNVWGVVHYGTAGSVNNSMSFGDVSVPEFVAFTGSWTWTKFGSKKEEYPNLSFGEYNVLKESKNLLSGVEFKPEELYPVGKPMEQVFWMQVNSEWYRVAEQLKTAISPGVPVIVL